MEESAFMFALRKLPAAGIVGRPDHNLRRGGEDYDYKYGKSYGKKACESKEKA